MTSLFNCKDKRKEIKGHWLWHYRTTKLLVNISTFNQPTTKICSLLGQIA